MTDKPLSGLKVVDLTHVLAGPYCAYQLGLLGAEVTKVEAPRGDMVRVWGGERAEIEAGLGTGFVAQNAGKRSVVIDIRKSEGADLVRELVKDADLFVENYTPGSMAKYGLGYEDLVAVNPSLIYLSISAFGQNGPEGHRPGFDDVVQATSGFMSINVRGDEPIRTGGPVVDYATGMMATSAVLAAVIQRGKTGEPQHIDVAMQDVTMLLMNRNTHIAATTGTPPAPAENREGPLLGRYRVKDGYVMLAGYRGDHQRGILGALGLDDYADLPGRELAARMDEIEPRVEAVLLEKTAAEWDVIFAGADVVAGGVRDLMEVFDSGQPAARELLTDVETALGSRTVTTAGYRINDMVFGPDGSVPGLGEHTREVLSGLGHGPEEIESLAAAGVIRLN